MSSTNLLPGQKRQDLLYARRNTRLFKWCVFIVLGIAGIGVVVVVGLTYINQSIDSLDKQTEQARQELIDQDLEGTQKRVKELSDSFNLALRVLSDQVLFSKLLEQAGAVMPSGTSLASLTIDELEGGIDLEAEAIDYQAATQVQVNLEDPNNQLFQEVDIITISCSIEEETYPCRGAYRALFAEDNPFKLLNSDEDAAR